MVKPKFTLTPDLVKVEPEPNILGVSDYEPVVRKVSVAKEAINVHISRDLKEMTILKICRQITESSFHFSLLKQSTYC